ncbi:hypothetical protein [Cellvibrio sp. OA-2007]|uniref:hypothetical protein n=1 Tax=Cellvibrio sp. OA-2007 TaxID=529823 RepID=UPI0007827779|nr:hypothetical protein [Cellvibrio sp. OA-2007]
MALTQSVQQFVSRTNDAHDFDVAQAVERGEFVLSLSTMLGCDYIFLSHKGDHPLLELNRIDTTIRELLDILDTSPHQSMVVSADENTTGALTFTRYDYTWDNRQVSNVIPTRVTHADQADFMQMMFDCSTTC